MNEHLCSNQEIRDYGGEPIALNIEKSLKKTKPSARRSGRENSFR